MRRVVRAVALSVSALLGASLPGAAGTAELLADLNQTPSFGSGNAGVFEPLIPVGDRAVFPAFEPSSGEELWVSDGTPLGTRLLRDVEPGGESSQYRGLGTVRQTALFLRDVGFGSGPWDLWRSDGTAAGTVPIAGLTELGPCAFRASTPEGVNLGSRFLFLAYSPGAGCGLWKTDGTAAGTRLIERVGSGRNLVAAGNRVFFFSGESSGLWVSNGDSADLLRSFEGFSSDGPRMLTAVGSQVAFLARGSEEDGEELWISDGTEAGTRALTQFFDAEPFSFSPFLKAVGNILYFTADDGTGVDLWQSQAGTAPRRVTDFIQSRPFGQGLDAGQLAVLGSRLIFIAQEQGQPRGALWVSAGTPASTAPLGGCPGVCPEPSGAELVQAGSRIVFAARAPQDRSEPWVTDGTGAGTRRLADLPGAFVSGFTALLGKVFFVSSVNSANNAGFFLWKTDGTPAGTVRVADLGTDPFGGSSFSSGFSPVAAGARFFFSANIDTRERQLWVSNGTPAGTRPVSSLRTVPGSFPSGFTAFAGGVLFGARKGSESGLWRSDGTATGTSLVQAGVNPVAIVPVANGAALVLSTDSSFSGNLELLRTDGTAAGTFQIEPPGGRVLGELTPFRNGAVFVVEREDHRFSLWESDGGLPGTAGTHSLAVLPAELSFFVHAVQAVGSKLYFFAVREPFAGEELWVSDGTTAGTRMVTSPDTLEGFSLDPEPRLVPVGETVFFADQAGLWKTDGTTVTLVWGTEQEEGRATDLTAFHGALYFVAGLPGNAAERGLWRTDGTEAGTFLVKAGGVPAERSRVTDPVRMVRLGDRLVYLADDGVHGAELWASDGTAAGTVLVRDIAPGEASSPSSGEPLTVAGGKVYFSATDGASGFELWESDGIASSTGAGTRRVQDIAPGAVSSSPRELAVSGNRLFFAADDGVHGEEPWALALGGGCAPSDTALCLGGRFRVEADWRDFAGHGGRGHAAALTGDTGTFWFFDTANVEVILKVLDGRGINGHHWVFYGALSNVEYTLTVTDTQSGAVRRYFNPRGWLGSLADTEAFGPRGASVAGVVSEGPVAQLAESQTAVHSTTAVAACVPSAERLCLQGNRFAVKVSWKRSNGTTGTGKAVPLAGGDTGYFWFFDAGNAELVVKVLDGRPFNGKHWAFFGALSDVEYTLTVTDTATGVMKTYKNPAGRLASVADTGAF